MTDIKIFQTSKRITILLSLAFMLVLFGLVLISASDEQLLSCVAGGDNELIIGCLSDGELIFIGDEAEYVSEWFTNIGADSEIEEVIIEPVPEEEVLEKGFFEKPLGIFLFLGLFVFLLILFYRRGKKKGEEEKKREMEKRNI